MSNLDQYRQSQEWEYVRERKFSHAGKLCADCDRDDCSGPIQVHHTAYTHFAHSHSILDFYEADLNNLDFLQVLCRKHHQEEHGRLFPERSMNSMLSPETVKTANWLLKELETYKEAATTKEKMDAADWIAAFAKDFLRRIASCHEELLQDNEFCDRLDALDVAA